MRNVLLEQDNLFFINSVANDYKKPSENTTAPKQQPKKEIGDAFQTLLDAQLKAFV